MAKTLTPGDGTAAALFGFGLQVVPSAYIVATGTVPSWARWSLGVFVGAWLLMAAIRSGRAAS